MLICYKKLYHHIYIKKRENEALANAYKRFSGILLNLVTSFSNYRYDFFFLNFSKNFSSFSRNWSSGSLIFNKTHIQVAETKLSIAPGTRFLIFSTLKKLFSKYRISTLENFFQSKITVVRVNQKPSNGIFKSVLSGHHQINDGARFTWRPLKAQS